MSNSIWKAPDIKPEDGATIAFYLEDSMGSGDYDYDENEILVNCGFIKFSRITKWAYLTDIIAQADKAERSQKAVDCALEELQRVAEDEDIDWLRAESARTTIDEIEHLTKETQ